MLKHLLIALAAGVLIVFGLNMLARHSLITPVPFFLLWPGIMAGALAPDSGYNPEGDIHPWGPVSTFIVHATNIAIYSGAVFIFLRLARRSRPRKVSEPSS
jgi:hypothetical protein